MRNVLEEVLEIFPSEYIHVGGDETPMNIWEKCPKCQNRMEEHGLKNEEELFGWFIQEIGDWLQTKNRKLVGWDWDKPDYFLDLGDYVEGESYQLRIRLEGTEKEGGGEIYFGLMP